MESDDTTVVHVVQRLDRLPVWLLMMALRDAMMGLLHIRRADCTGCFLPLPEDIK
jgi:hypothetical protein